MPARSLVPSAQQIANRVWNAATRTLTSGSGGATAAEVWAHVTRTLTTTIPSAADVATAVWAAATRTLTTTIPTAAAISAAVWAEATRTLTTTIPTAAAIATAVWAETVRTLSSGGNTNVATAVWASGTRTLTSGGGGGNQMPLVITSTSEASLGIEFLASFIFGGTPAIAALAWPSANRAIYIPFRVHTAVTAKKIFILNGTAGTGDNVDVGIYSYSAGVGTLVVSSGSTAHTGSSQSQSFDIADTALAAGNYFMALACNGTTSTFMRINGFSADSGEPHLTTGVYQQASAFPLPSTLTLARNTTEYVPVMGVVCDTLVP